MNHYCTVFDIGNLMNTLRIKIWLILLTGLLILQVSRAQQTGKMLVLAQLHNGDTIPVVNLQTVVIYGLPVFKSKKEQRKWDKLVRNVKKVYPYAKLAGIKFREYEVVLSQARTEKERKAFLKKAEKELNDKYSEELKSLTFSQGKVLLKLVDRETGNCSYELVRELKGKFMAFFWQSFARIFGYNLKEKYDPYGKDAEIEQIVVLIENGAL